MAETTNRYAQHWRRVFTELAGLPDAIIDDRWHDCPCCQAAGTFKARTWESGAHVICNSCGEETKTGGMIMPLDLVSRLLGVDRYQARLRIDDFLGFEPNKKSNLLIQLGLLPKEWGLVAVGSRKRAYMDRWQKNPLNATQVKDEISAGRACAVGVLAGPASGGLLFLDHDGHSATAKLEELGIPLRDLPRTVSVTSGRDGRFQSIYRVPEMYWSAMRGQKVFKTGVFDPDGKEQQLDLRWVGHQSVVIGEHPETTGYRWLEGRSPLEMEVAEAPESLIELLLCAPEPEAAALPSASARVQLPDSASGAVVPFLDFVSKFSRDLVENGGTPGSWNVDQMKLAMDLVGTESWLVQQGVRTDMTAEDAFGLHVRAARGKAKDFSERKAWARFHGAPKQSPSPATPTEKLAERVAYHTRAERAARAPRPKQRSTEGVPSGDVDQAEPGVAERGCGGRRLRKLEAHELMNNLRELAANGESLRWNTFSQQIEMNGRVLEHAEHFYLDLADSGFKVGKEMALDCLVKVAHEHPYDPVRMYLEHVAATVEPYPLDRLATTYLRAEDAVHPEPTIYDHMLRVTLIGAVKRVFEPGCKHDTALVLVGDQGARKSSFWAVLGGQFFSDSLGDIGDKDDLLKLHRSWIMEWAELDQITNKKHAGQIKSFLSQSTDLFRVPYGKAVEQYPRRGVIVGSTNRSAGFLQDETGNRRFLVIPTTCTAQNPIDTPTLAADRDAIISAAVAAYRAGEANFLPKELGQEVDKRNEEYQIDHPWVEPIERWLLTARASLDPITTSRALAEAIKKPAGMHTRGDQMAVAEILRAAGYVRRRGSDGRTRIWEWVLPSGVCPTSERLSNLAC